MRGSAKGHAFFIWGGIDVVDFERLYFKLFAAMADAIDALQERNDTQQAIDILIQAHIEAEEIYISDED